ncbi:MAG: hypothetical protein K0S34_2657 [Bacillales bacterium]|nr:hypothetical protein [Bacillales bacterium]
MTWIGYVFWSICIVTVILGFYMEKRYGATSIEKSNKQVTNEEITRVTHSNNWPKL